MGFNWRKKVKHNLIGPPRYAWECRAGMWEFIKHQKAGYSSNRPYEISLIVGSIRPALGRAGLVAGTEAWVASLGDFETLREFTDLSEAKIYIESLVSLDGK